MKPLLAFVQDLRDRHGFVPDFDPLDGGARARLLLLLETPGPRIFTSAFVSRDNPTGTAANLFRFTQAAGIPRREMVVWNTVPWVIHQEGARNRAPRRTEILTGLRELPALIALLPRLRGVILAGRVAGLARPILAGLRSDLPVVEIPHPSPTYVCTSPEVPRRILDGLRQAGEWLPVDPVGS
ncbi:MAG: uracil-DNA glycosylase [Microvirga sp.]